jgi:hypothetical protein
MPRPIYNNKRLASVYQRNALKQRRFSLILMIHARMGIDVAGGSNQISMILEEDSPRRKAEELM